MLHLLPIMALAIGTVIAHPELKQAIPASQLKTVGLIGGTSWHSTIEYYRYINQTVNDLYGNNTNPPLVIYNVNQREIHSLQVTGQWGQIADILAAVALSLRAAGAEAVLFCANTPYEVYSEVSRKTGMPILHIGDATGMAIQKAGLTKVGLIGTKYTMEDGFMQHWLQVHYAIEVVVPASSKVREKLQRVIQNELGMGIFKAETKRYILEQIQELRRRGPRE